MRNQLHIGKVAGFIERPHANSSAGKCAINYRKKRSVRVVDKYLDRPSVNIPFNPNRMPMHIRQGSFGFYAGNASPGPSIDNKNSVMDRLFGSGIHGKVGVIKMHWIDVIEDQYYGFVISPNPCLK